MPWVGFEPTISAGERPKTYALDRAATGTGKWAIAFLNESSWQSSWRMPWSLYKTARNSRDVYRVLIVEIIMASV